MASLLVCSNVQLEVLPLTGNVGNGLLYGQLLAGSSGYLSNHLRELVKANLNNLLQGKFITYCKNESIMKKM